MWAVVRRQGAVEFSDCSLCKEVVTALDIETRHVILSPTASYRACPFEFQGFAILREQGKL